MSTDKDRELEDIATLRAQGILPKERQHIETDHEVIQKRTREMQATQRFQGEQTIQGQTGPATRNLTIIWDDEKQAMLERIQALEIQVSALYEHFKFEKPL